MKTLASTYSTHKAYIAGEQKYHSEECRNEQPCENAEYCASHKVPPLGPDAVKVLNSFAVLLTIAFHHN